MKNSHNTHTDNEVSRCCFSFFNLYIASKVTEIGRNSVMYVSDQFIDWQLQLTHYRDPSTKLGFLVG